jgi:selenocysteine lyase/cysteine desulfurase
LTSSNEIDAALEAVKEKADDFYMLTYEPTHAKKVGKIKVTVREKKFKVLCRPGLHCAPSAHRTIGTFPDGTIRLSIGAFNTEEDIRKTIDAVAQISASSA